MAYGMDDRVREQISGASGTGPFTLPVSAVPGFQTFLAGWGASGTGEFTAVIGSQWQTGFGTLNAGGTTITFTEVYDGSSGASVAVNFTSGTMDIFGDIPAELGHHLNLREITVTSAATCDIGAVRGSRVLISGSTGPITSFGTSKNRLRFVRFANTPTITHNATSMILPGGKSIVAVTGDTAIFVSDGAGNWRCIQYQRDAGVVGAVRIQVFTATGTYTPDANLLYAVLECVGAGAGGGGCANGSGTGAGGAGGGGAGGYSRIISTAATIGASQAVTIGALGAGGSAGNNNGTAGGDTSVGSICIGKGGSGGSGAAAGASGGGGAGGVAGTGTVTDVGDAGVIGGNASVFNTFAPIYGGKGGNSRWGAGGSACTGDTTGNGASGYGGGGGGGAVFNTNGARAGGPGTGGRVIITEYCRQ